MLPEKMKELAAARAKLASLEKSIQGELNKELAALPAKYGFESAADFVAAVAAACGTKVGRKARRAKGPGRPPGAKKRRKRAVITDETRAEVKKLVEAGKTGAEIAKTVGVSLPSVQNIKKALGLVTKR